MQTNKTPYKILQRLIDGQFKSGQALGEELNITRSAVWKAIQNLMQYGIEIESVVGKGYRIVGGMELLDENKIQRNLNSTAQEFFPHISLHKQIKSTNSYLLNLAKNKQQQNMVCIAEQQTDGRGRQNKTWVSPFGHNIYCSVLWHFKKDPSEITGLSLVVAIAVVNALKAYGINEGLQVKWPNDVLYKGRKIAGILLEMLAEPYGDCRVIIGLGINTRISKLCAEQINQPWASVEEVTGKLAERNKLAALLINEISTTLEKFTTSGLAPFIKDWNELDAYTGKSVTISTPTRTINGTVRGISERGELILENENQQLELYMSGEVSLRPVESLATA